jgi:hypothetical protein
LQFRSIPGHFQGTVAIEIEVKLNLERFQFSMGLLSSNENKRNPDCVAIKTLSRGSSMKAS